MKTKRLTTLKVVLLVLTLNDIKNKPLRFPSEFIDSFRYVIPICCWCQVVISGCARVFFSLIG